MYRFCVLNKGKSGITVLLNFTKVFSSLFDKTKLLAEIFSENSNFYDWGIYLPAFSSRTNLKLHNIPVTPKLFEKVITDLDSSKVFLRTVNLNFYTY